MSSKCKARVGRELCSKGRPPHSRASVAQTLTEMDGVTEMWWPQAPHPSAATGPCDGGVWGGHPVVDKGMGERRPQQKHEQWLRPEARCRDGP